MSGAKKTTAKYPYELMAYASRLGEEVVIDVLAKGVKKNSRAIAKSILKNFELKVVVKTDPKTGEWSVNTGAKHKKKNE